MITTEEVPMPEPAIHGVPKRLPQPISVGCDYYTADQLRAYADARCAKLQEEVDTARRTAEYWKANSNAANAEIDALAENVKALQDDARRYRWLRDNKQRRRDGDYMNPAFCGVEFYHRAEGIIGPGPDLDAAIDAAGDQP